MDTAIYLKDFRNAKRLADSLELLGIEHADSFIIARAHLGLAEVFVAKGKYSKALQLARSAQKIFQRNKKVSLIGLTYKIIGRTFWECGVFDSATNYLVLALNCFEVAKDTQNKPPILVNLGNVFYSQGDYVLALKYYSEAESLARSIGDSQRLCGSLNNIGLCYCALGRYELARNAFTEVINLKPTTEILAASVNNLGSIYDLTSDYISAIKAYKTALRKYKRLGLKSKISNCLTNIGDTYLKIRECDSAHTYFYKAYRIDSTLGKSYDIFIDRLNLACVFINDNKIEDADRILNSLLFHDNYEIRWRANVLSARCDFEKGKISSGRKKLVYAFTIVDSISKQLEFNYRLSFVLAREKEFTPLIEFFIRTQNYEELLRFVGYRSLKEQVLSYFIVDTMGVICASSQGIVLSLIHI